MKRILFLLALLSSTYLCAQEQSETIKKDISLDQSPSSTQLIVRNIWGDITIEGYEGATIQMEAKKTITGSSQSIVDVGMEEVKIAVINKGDVIGIVMQTPCSRNPSLISREELRKGWNEWNEDCRWNPKYDVNIAYTLKVPKALNLKAGTVNNGNVLVKNVGGDLDMNNVNGSITLEQVAGATDATTVNGDVTITYTAIPEKDCKYYTLNGDINAYFPGELNAYVSFKTFQGDFYTDLDDIKLTSPQITQSKAAKSKGIAFKIDGAQRMQAGKGGVNLVFETFNGDAYLRKR